MNEKPPTLLLRFWPWGFIFSILLILLAGIFAKPAYRTAKMWRADAYLAQAEKALQSGDTNRALQRSKLCLQFNPESIAAYRLLAQIAVKRNDPGSLNLWTMVLQSGKATDADRVAFGEAALRENLLMVAERQLEILLVRPSPSKEAYNLAGLFAVRQQRPALARQWFLKALALDPTYVRAEINLARIQLFFADNQKTEQLGIEHLRQLAKREDEWGRESLRMLVEWGLGHAGRLPFDSELSGLLQKHPQAKMQDRCLAAQWEIQTYPERKDALLDTLTKSTKALSTQDQRDLAAWLNSQGLYEKTLTIFPLDPKAPDPLLLVQLDAMAGLGRWQELEVFLQQDLSFDEPTLLWLYRARTAKELGKENLYELNWQQAARTAEKKPLALRYLAYYAEMIGDLPRALAAYESLSEMPNYQLEALLKLVRPYEKLGKTRELLKTLQRLATMRPNDPAINNDLAYLALLLNDTSLQPFETARRLYEINPNVPPFAATYALAQLKAGSPTVALKVMRTFTPEELTAPSWQAVYAAALDANGLKSEAVKAVKNIDYQNLKPEEKQLIAPFWKPE